jgi:hypothetical protein
MKRVAVLADNTDNYRPHDTALAKGELVINDAVVSNGLYYKTEANKVVKVGPCHIGKEPPNSYPPVISSFSGFASYKGWCEGELWLDNSEQRPLLKIYDGVRWITLNPPLKELFDELDTVFPNRVVCESVLHVKKQVFCDAFIDISQNDSTLSTTRFVHELLENKLHKAIEDLKDQLVQELKEKLSEELKDQLIEELKEKLSQKSPDDLKEDSEDNNEEGAVKKTVNRRKRSAVKELPN